MILAEAGLTAPIHIRPRSAPVKLDAPPLPDPPHTNLTSSSSDTVQGSVLLPHYRTQPQYGIRPPIAWTHRPLPDPPHTNWTYSPNTVLRDSPHYRLDAPPPSRSAPHKLDLQPQYGIPPPRTAPTHIRPNPHSPPFFE